MSAFGAFGQQSSAFGATSAFGASSAPFGAAATPFGGQNVSTSLFGASQQQQQQQQSAFGGFGQSSGFGPSVFGASSSSFGASASAFGGSNSAFGASSSAFGSSAPGFGATGFGATGFGAQQSSAFGGSVAPFGASSSAFGSTSLFGSATGSSLFGNQSNNGGAFSSSAFGQSQSTWGASSSAFGSSTPFAASSSLFGGASSSSLFGAQSGSAFGATSGTQQQCGTSGVNWQITVEYDTTPGTQSKYHSISMMQQLRDRSLEELRFEDYVAGNKAGSMASSGGGASFGAPAQSAPATGVFGASAPGFGQALGFGNSANSQPAFGGSSSASLFGSAGGGAFGASSIAGQSVGGVFGATSSSSFGAQSGGGVFGNAQSASGFGGGGGFPNSIASFGQSSSLFAQSSAFGATSQSQSLFGQSSSANLFNGSGNGSTPFGQVAPTQSAAGLFGAQPNISFGNLPQPGQFGANSGGTGFGATAPVPSFPSTVAPNAGFGAYAAPAANPAGSVPTVPSAVQNPSLIDSFNSVVHYNGTTVAPPGANYATVLHNLQRLQDDIAKNNRLLEEQKRSQSVNKQGDSNRNDSISIVVLPPPATPRFSANHLTLGHNGTSRNGSASKSVKLSMGLQRTPMRNSLVLSKYSGEDPEDALGRQTQSDSHSSKNRNGFGDAVVFFTPNQFSGVKRRPLRASEVDTPVRLGRLITPKMNGSDNANGNANESSRNGLVGSFDNNVMEHDRANGIAAGDRVKDNDSLNEHVTDAEETPRDQVRGATGNRSDSGGFLWSAKRPSQWSVNQGLASPDQYDPSKYLPVISRSEYYTVPSGLELAARTMEELQHVEGFTIGREGYGKIEWMEPVDVRGLVIDNCVEISRGEVAVMPQREASQLDARAKITLEGMLPKAKKGRNGDVAPISERYEKSLRRFCEQNGLRFISYDSTDGLWSFEAQSFKD